MARYVIACRVASYGPFRAGAYAHLAELGVRHVEIAVPPPDQLDATAAELERHGLTATSLHGQCDVSHADIAGQIRAQLPAFERLGARIFFASVKAGDLPRATACARLREAGEVAGTSGVTIALETHPDLVTNSRVGLETMQSVDHPNVRINFDTANIYFYNHDVDAVSELRLVLPCVAALHLKETNGGYRQWHFPALGRGIVDFPAIFRLLDEANFTGPCTLEIEGIEGEENTEPVVRARIAASVAYLKGLGRL